MHLGRSRATTRPFRTACTSEVRDLVSMGTLGYAWERYRTQLDIIAGNIKHVCTTEFHHSTCSPSKFFIIKQYGKLDWKKKTSDHSISERIRPSGEAHPWPFLRNQEGVEVLLQRWRHIHVRWVPKAENPANSRRVWRMPPIKHKHSKKVPIFTRNPTYSHNLPQLPTCFWLFLVCHLSIYHSQIFTNTHSFIIHCTPSWTN